MKRGTDLECFLCTRQARAKRYQKREVRRINILVQDPFYFDDPFERKSCLF
jgi:hypothetical protein